MLCSATQAYIPFTLAPIFTTVKDKSIKKIPTKNQLVTLFTTEKHKLTLELRTSKSSVFAGTSPMTKRKTSSWKTFAFQLTTISSSSNRNDSEMYFSKYEKIGDAWKIGCLVILVVVLLICILGVTILLKIKYGDNFIRKNSTRSEDSNYLDKR